MNVQSVSAADVSKPDDDAGNGILINKMNKLTIENISHADDEFLKLFNQEITGLDEKLIRLINDKGVKIILADKLSDVNKGDNSDIEKYQDYHPADRDKVCRGLCSDNLNALCIFYNTVSLKELGAVLYHEIGHLIDIYPEWGKDEPVPALSTKQEFINAYNKDITLHWEQIKNDNRFRLKHYVQNSAPDNASRAGLCETFAFCFAGMHNRFEDNNILKSYFPNAQETAEDIIDDFFNN